MTKIIDNRDKLVGEITLGVGDWFYLKEHDFDHSYLCVIAQVLSSECNVICFEKNDANRMLDSTFKYDEDDGEYHNLSKSVISKITDYGRFTIEKVDVTLTVNSI